ncbi:hypothetical protein P691DRAFT_802682 [Macrolepiota fuliginosa MF-IS2]|uniref:Uncharacterized protein n=1 Tax=Macrolepiota fuliginosa MF-IS2 TaxID=1400762 RepID=A0A9P6C315_9AGAR|nr:hypothetical protein P691DRAFT_802682 [Macrolepiota fuliginosa MF-IS2]
MRAGLRSVLGAVGLRFKEPEPDGWYWFDTYAVEDFWGSPAYAYYIKEEDLGMEGWYVVELRVMRQRLSKKNPSNLCREYIVAIVARTEIKDPTGNGFLIFERVKDRKPTMGWDPEGAHPDRKNERWIFEDKKAYQARPSDEDFLRYKQFSNNPRLRFMHVDRVRICARPWLYETDEIVAVLKLPLPQVDLTPTITTMTPRTISGSETKPKCEWLFVWELIYIAKMLNRCRELYQIFPKTCHWLPGMMINIVRIWTGASLELRHRDGKRSAKVPPMQDMLDWFEQRQLVMQRQKPKDREKEDYSDVMRIIKTPRNNTVRILVQQCWDYVTTQDVLGMFEKLELQERQRQAELNRQLAEDMAKMRKRTDEKIRQIYAQKDKEIMEQQRAKDKKKSALDARPRKVRLEVKGPGEDRRVVEERAKRSSASAGERKSGEGSRTERKSGEGSRTEKKSGEGLKAEKKSEERSRVEGSGGTSGAGNHREPGKVATGKSRAKPT